MDENPTPPGDPEASSSVPPTDPEHGEAGQRPTPVRAVMEGGESEGPEDELDRLFVEPESGREWIVRVSGRSSGGVLPLRTIPLMDLTFSPTDDPDHPGRHAFFPGESLEAIRDEELILCLNAAGPIPRTENEHPQGSPPNRKRRGSKRPRK